MGPSGLAQVPFGLAQHNACIWPLETAWMPTGLAWDHGALDGATLDYVGPFGFAQMPFLL